MNTGYLFASLIWGSLGLGYFVYGRKQRSSGPMLGGVIMMGTSYFAGSILVMSLVCIAVMAGVYGWSRMSRY